MMWNSLIELLVYPPSQSFKPYYDTSSSEEASVHGEDEAFLEKPAIPKTSRKRNWRFICSSSTISLLISIITAGLVIVVLLVTTKGHPLRVLKQSALSAPLSAPLSLHGKGPESVAESDNTVKHLHCGSTPDEARALGCVFDVMSFAWTPPACYDHSLSQQFLAEQGPWTFYLDHNATQPLVFEELSDYNIVWTEHSYHVVHCLYAWRRIHQAYLADTLLLPAELGSINHTTHCVGLLEEVEGAPRRKVNAIAYLVFDGCVDLN
jgi:hypothetical protein